jgi:predicted DNA-binding transcriptional regulator YafY
VKDRRKLSETVARYLRMLQLVPLGRKVDAAYIEQQLAVEGFEIHRRSIQRDLEMLSHSFPGLSCDSSSKPYGWSWDKHAPLFDIPCMNVQTAVTLELVRAYVSPALPRATLQTLQKYFARAREAIAQSPGARLARWPRKVKVIPRGQPLLPAAVADAVLDVVYSSLLEERRFLARYRKRGASTDKEYEVNPLGLVVRNGILLLVCSFGDDPMIKHMVLHRVRAIRALDRSATIPADFNLQTHLDSGGAAFRLGRKISLRLLMHRDAAITLHETPLSHDQKISDYDDDQERIEATVPDTLELRGWLASYGGRVEVLGPAPLREHMARVAKEMAERYRPGLSRAHRSAATSKTKRAMVRSA